MAAHSPPSTVLQVIPIEAPANMWVWVQQIAQRTNGIIDWINGQGGTTHSAAYRFQSGTAAPPGVGNVRFDNAAAGAAANIFVSDTTGGGSDIGNLLKLAQAGDQIYLQNKTDSSIYQIFTLTGAAIDGTVSPGGYHVLPVAWQDGAGTFANNEQVTFTLISHGSSGVGGGGGLPEAPTDGQLYSRRGSDTSWQVSPGSGGGGIPDAPSDSVAYGRENGGWVPVLALSGDILDGGNF